jgi:hypothetical protein
MTGSVELSSFRYRGSVGTDTNLFLVGVQHSLSLNHIPSPILPMIKPFRPTNYSKSGFDPSFNIAKYSIGNH